MAFIRLTTPMKNKCNFYKIACGFLAFIALISIGVFVLYWKDSHISFIMSDWGSFADYISGIPLSIITILSQIFSISPKSWLVKNIVVF